MVISMLERYPATNAMGQMGRDRGKEKYQEKGSRVKVSRGQSHLHDVLRSFRFDEEFATDAIEVCP